MREGGEGGEGGEEVRKGGRGGREKGRRRRRRREGLERGRQKESERGRERVTHSVRAYPQEGIYHWPMNLLARIRHAIRQQLFNRSIFVFDQ